MNSSARNAALADFPARQPPSRKITLAVLLTASRKLGQTLSPTAAARSVTYSGVFNFKNPEARGGLEHTYPGVCLCFDLVSRGVCPTHATHILILSISIYGYHGIEVLCVQLRQCAAALAQKVYCS